MFVIGYKMKYSNSYISDWSFNLFTGLYLNMVSYYPDGAIFFPSRVEALRFLEIIKKYNFYRYNIDHFFVEEIKENEKS